MQVDSERNAAARLDRVLAREVPGGRGWQAWGALLRAHATLLRQLETDLETKTGLALADYDVLAQLAIAGGSLRMTELADRAVVSRFSMTQGVDRVVDQGRRRPAPRAHLCGVSFLFVANLYDQELALLETALAKVTLDCTFGQAKA